MSCWRVLGRFLTVVSAMLLAAPAMAQTVFTDRASFEQARNLTTFDFDGLTAVPDFATNPSGTTPAFEVADGALSSVDLSGSNAAFNAEHLIGDEDLLFLFQPDTEAFGFDYVATGTVTVRFNGNQFTVDLSGSGFFGAFLEVGSGFAGYQNIEVLVDNPNTIAVDNVTFGDAAVIPEPETWIMMIVGFGIAGLGLRRRNRRASAAA
ncbi:MAG: PEPxxWA-CTERM sorting domain-containing protein [Alphaproteobacteria bacterium]